MADEPIGSVKVDITGDYSNLEASFNRSQELSQQFGIEIVNSFTTASAGTKKFDDDLKALTDSGMTQAQAMAAMWSQSLIKVQEGFDSTTQSAAGAVAPINAAGDAAAGAIPPIKGAGDAAAGAAGDFNQAAAATTSFTASLADMVAGLLTAQALKQLGEDSLAAYGHLQALTTSLDLMGAGAAGAAADVEKLRALAIQTATPFDEMAAQARKLSAVFGTGDNMFAVMKAAADDAAATGRSFDTVANGLERIEAVGTLTGRQLVTLGISWEQMAESMGVSVAEAQARMKQGAQSASQDVADTINAIESKFAGASERQAANVLGVWANVKNQATFIFQTLGEQMGGLGPLILDGLKIAASGVIAFIGGIQQVTVAVVGMVREGIEGIKGLGAVAAAVASGNFAQAAIAAADAYAKVKNAAEYTDQSLQDHAKKTAEALIAIWSDNANKVSATFKPTSGVGGGELKATQDKIKGFTDLTTQTAVWIAMEKAEIAAQQEAVKETAKFNEATGASASVQDYLAIQVAMASERVNAFGDLALPKAKEGVSALEKETNKLSGVMGKLGDEVNEAAQGALDDTPWGKMDAALKKLGLTEDDLATKSRAGKVAAAEYIAANSTDMSKVAASWEVINGEVGRLSKVNLPAAIVLQKDLVESMKAAGAPMGQIIAAEDKLYSKEIELNTERGRASNALIIAQANARAGINALTTANNTLGNTYVALQHDFAHTFDTLGGAFAKAIMEGKSFTATWKAALHELQTQILTTVISAIIKFGVSWVTAHVLGTVAGRAHNAAEIAGIGTVSAARAAATTAQLAQIAAVTAAQTAATATFVATQTAAFIAVKVAASILDVAEVFGDAAVGGAAAMASTAAIPIIGPALAPAAGAAMYAMIAGTYAPLATFSEGGMVPEDMLALVHKGEYVLNAEKTAAASVGGGGSGETHMHFDFTGAHFSNGINDTQVMSVFNRAFRMSKLAGAFPPGRFPS